MSTTEERAEALGLQHEREQVEQVFGLTGGELADEPMVDAEGRRFRFWYEGAPEYAESDFKQYDTVRTIVSCGLFGGPPEVLKVDDETWKRVGSFTSSGEAECPEHGKSVRDQDECPLCGAKRGESHGHIYLGDGWAEYVYAREEEET